MGQAFLRGQASGGKIDFSKLNHQIVYQKGLSPNSVATTIPGPGLYVISWSPALYTTVGNSLRLRTSAETNVSLSNYAIELESTSDHYEVVLDIYDNGDGTFSVYGWNKSTGVYTLITDKAVSFRNGSPSTSMLLVIVRLYQ